MKRGETKLAFIDRLIDQVWKPILRRQEAEAHWNRKVAKRGTRSPDCHPEATKGPCSVNLICQRCDNCLAHCACCAATRAKKRRKALAA